MASPMTINPPYNLPYNYFHFNTCIIFISSIWFLVLIKFKNVREMCCYVLHYYFTIALAEVSSISVYSRKIGDTFRLIKENRVTTEENLLVEEPLYLYDMIEAQCKTNVCPYFWTYINRCQYH